MCVNMDTVYLDNNFPKCHSFYFNLIITVIYILIESRLNMVWYLLYIIERKALCIYSVP